MNLSLEDWSARILVILRTDIKRFLGRLLSNHEFQGWLKKLGYITVKVSIKFIEGKFRTKKSWLSSQLKNRRLASRCLRSYPCCELSLNDPVNRIIFQLKCLALIFNHTVILARGRERDTRVSRWICLSTDSNLVIWIRTNSDSDAYYFESGRSQRQLVGIAISI
jgi:hypothetical protein